MDINGNNKNGSGESPTQVAETPDRRPPNDSCRRPTRSTARSGWNHGTTFATRAAIKGADGITKGKLLLLGGGLAVGYSSLSSLPSSTSLQRSWQ